MLCGTGCVPALFLQLSSLEILSCVVSGAHHFHAALLQQLKEESSGINMARVSKCLPASALCGSRSYTRTLVRVPVIIIPVTLDSPVR